jgi:hypothetical protein
VISTFETAMRKDSFDNKINESPREGSCSIDPFNGTTLTLFTINCSNWVDQDQIKDFTFYGSYLLFKMK